MGWTASFVLRELLPHAVYLETKAMNFLRRGISAPTVMFSEQARLVEYTLTIGPTVDPDSESDST